MTTDTAAFVFDRDYKNLAQVFPFVAAYADRLATLEAAGAYPYNDSFKGHIPGIEGQNEDTAIYLLQSLRNLQDVGARLNAAWDEGFRPLEQTDRPAKVRSLVEFGWYVGGSGFRRSDDVRLVPQNRSLVVLAKGARTRGRLAEGVLWVLA